MPSVLGGRLQGASYYAASERGVLPGCGMAGARNLRDITLGGSAWLQLRTRQVCHLMTQIGYFGNIVSGVL